MKIVNRICQVFAIIFGLTALVSFFFQFATIVTDGQSANAVGTVLAFGGTLKVGGAEYDMARSADILICFLLTAIGFLLSVFSFKSKKLRYAAPALGLIASIYMLVISLSSEMKFIDIRPLQNVSEVTYAPMLLVCTIALFAFSAAAIAYLLIDDYIEVASSKGALTIPKRIAKFFRDYKSELKKITWPTIREIVKNTLIVLIICLIIGALIWIFDKGLGELIKLILIKK